MQTPALPPQDRLGKQSGCSERLLRFLECWRSFLFLSCCPLLGCVTVGSTQKIAIRAWGQVSTGPRAAKYPELPANWIRRALVFSCPLKLLLICSPSFSCYSKIFIHSFFLHCSFHFPLLSSLFIFALSSTGNFRVDICSDSGKFKCSGGGFSRVGNKEDEGKHHTFRIKASHFNLGPTALNLMVDFSASCSVCALIAMVTILYVIFG